MARIGVLTGGGDCAGLDAVIRALVRRGESVHGDEFVGIRDGWRGLLDDDTTELSVERTAGILTRGGTLLGTSRTDPLAAGNDGIATIRQTMNRHQMDCLIVIGGDGTLRAARQVALNGVPVVAVPKTIDNDIDGTETTVGFQTAVQVATDAIDRLQTTAESHNRVMVVEVMGRDSGWIATYAGLAGGADAILIPERPFAIGDVCEQIKRRHARKANFSIVVVAEGARPNDWDPEPVASRNLDAGTHIVMSGIGVALQHEIAARTGYDTRTTVLGHVLRGGTPTAADRILATRFGIAASDAAAAGCCTAMIALQGGRVVHVGLRESLKARNRVELELYENAAVFFG